MAGIPPVRYKDRTVPLPTHRHHDIITAMRALEPTVRPEPSRRRNAWALLIAFVLAGCVSLPVAPSRRSAAHLPADLERYYDYSPAALEAAFEPPVKRSGYTLRRGQLSGEGLEPIRIDWYQPDRPGRLPAVLMSPILAGNDLYVREFARFYAARGMHAFLVYRKKEPFSADRPLTDVEDHLRRTVIELRRSLDWIERQDSVEGGRIGTFAISLGAILTCVLSAVEPRIRCSVLGLPAGHVPEIILHSKDRSLRKRRRAYLEKRGWTQGQALEELRSVVRTEPLAFAAGVDPDRMLVIAGLFDRVLGFGRSLELWRALGRPRIILLPTGHYTAYFAIPYLKIATYSFLRRHLAR